MIEIYPAISIHAFSLATRLRVREKEAYEQLGDAYETIAQEMRRSLYSYAVLYEGQVVAIYGVKGTLIGDSAYLWLVCSETCEKFPITFLRQSRKVVDDLLTRFSRVHGLVLCDFEKSVRWLRWIGCDMHEPVDGVMAWDRKNV